MITQEVLLKKAKLRNTEPRERILSVFQNSAFALSHGDIEEAIGEGIDRVTIYRTLRTFVEHGLLHTVPDQHQGIRYALCAENCEEDNHDHENENHLHHHNHLHFRCESCKNTRCLPQSKLPEIELPSGFVSKEAVFLIYGLCDSCSG